MDLVGEVAGGRPALHEEGIGEHPALAVGEFMLVLDREDDDHIKEVEDRGIQRLLDAGAVEPLHELCHLCEPGTLRRAEACLRVCRETRVPGNVTDELPLRGHPEREFSGSAREDDVVFREPVQALLRRQVGFVPDDQHRLADRHQFPAEPDEALLPGSPEVDTRPLSGVADVLERHPEAGKGIGDRGGEGEVPRLGLPLEFRPVARENAVHPHRELVLEELDVLYRVARSDTDRVPLGVRPAAGIDDLEDRVRLPEVVEELVPKPPPLVRLGHEARHVDQPDGDEPDPVEAVPARDVHLPAGAGGPDVCDAVVGVDRRERIVGDLYLGQGRRPEKRRFAAVGFSCNGQCDHEQLLSILHRSA